ncbi:hypothetical protein [Aminipila terrae]|uniref:Uncharacterized protein n=1 Tax=Aminipila terrae TaxID=2697030 RepID=A0A6P1MQ01_9FIRM|nr:hypothetical protein [Aminipila terrae]QHI73075.1 hypothetical protein Ami3637_12290 [Aminipila terrae]
MESVKEKLSDKVISLNEQIPDNPCGQEMKSYQENGMAFSLHEVKQRLEMLQNFISEIMVEGTDYGYLPKTDKKCLFKSGAEKLCDVFGLSKRIEIVSRMEDFDKGIFHYEVKAIVIDKKTGVIEAEGVGSCNSMEKKYRSQDAYNLTNTILKMAKKRAFVDAVLSATRSSDIFTQDVEDNLLGDGAEGKPRNMKDKSRDKKNTVQDQNGKAGKEESASNKQLSYIYTILSDSRIPVETARSDMEKMYGVTESRNLSKKQASEFIEYLKNYKKAG